MSVSIIIPAYNSEKTIERCVKSAVNIGSELIQEVIVVDDGSTDGTAQICEELEKDYNKIKYFKKNNGGVSAARNYGIDKSNSQFIMFLDSDDELIADGISKMVEHIAEYDFVIAGLELHTDAGKQCIVHSGNYSNVELTSKYGSIIPEVLINGPCAKLYSKQIIEQNNIRFRENITLGEDTLFVFEYLKSSKSIKMLDDVVYIYYQLGENSLMTKFREDGYSNAKYVYSELFNICSDINGGKVFESLEFKYKNVLMFYMQKTIINKKKLSGGQLNKIIKDYCNDQVVRKCIRKKKSRSLGWMVADFLVMIRCYLLLKLLLTVYLRR